MAGLQHEPERPQKTGAAAVTVPGSEALASSGLGRFITVNILTLHNSIHGHWSISGGISHNSPAAHIFTHVIPLCIMYPPFLGRKYVIFPLRHALPIFLACPFQTHGQK
jgi:hypothetical protein